MTRQISGLGRRLAGTALSLAICAGVILPGTQAFARPGDTGEGPNAARVLIDGYAACMVRSGKKTLGPILRRDPDNGAFERWVRNLRGQCILVTNTDYYVNPSPSILRMAVADVLVRQLKHRADPAQIAKVPPLIHPRWPAGETDATRSKSFGGRIAWLSRLGECIVRADPRGADSLLASDVESHDELAKINALSTAIATCSQAHRAKASVLEIRGAVALSYYRLLQATRNAGGAD